MGERYLLTYAVINIFAMVNRLQEFFYDKNYFVLYLLQFLTEPMQGFLNAIAYLPFPYSSLSPPVFGSSCHPYSSFDGLRYAWNEPDFLEQYKMLFYGCRCCPKKVYLSLSISFYLFLSLFISFDLFLSLSISFHLFLSL